MSLRLASCGKSGKALHQKSNGFYASNQYLMSTMSICVEKEVHLWRTCVASFASLYLCSSLMCFLTIFPASTSALEDSVSQRTASTQEYPPEFSLKPSYFGFEVSDASLGFLQKF